MYKSLLSLAKLRPCLIVELKALFEVVFNRSFSKMAAENSNKLKLKTFIIWLAPRAGKMSQILRCDWLPERARWSYLTRSGLPVARPLGIESLIPTTMRVFFDFLLVLRENAQRKVR